MPDYEKMYFTLFNKVSDIIEELMALQKEVEELYISSSLENEAEGASE
ncbi:MAG: hypothetical protein RRZ70_06420 [Synergistaceae bacterium]